LGWVEFAYRKPPGNIPQLDAARISTAEASAQTSPFASPPNRFVFFWLRNFLDQNATSCYNWRHRGWSLKGARNMFKFTSQSAKQVAPT
jgi:hypothetical protein